jgi:large repetitive protein
MHTMKHIFTLLFLMTALSLSAQRVYLVKDLNGGTASGFPSFDSKFKLLGGLDSVAIFLASGKGGVKLLCSSDGTNIGTISILPPLAADETLLYPTVSDNRFWFVIRDGDDHDKLYSTDGTWAGTQVRVNETAARIRELKAIAGGVVYARNPDNFDDEELIRVRLTGSNIQKTVLAKFYWFGGLLEFAVADSNTIWGIGSSGPNDRSLFKCTGQANSRTNIAVINTGSEFNLNIFMTIVGAKCYWFWQPDGGVRKLWVSDGTAAGTMGLVALDDLAFQDLQEERAIIGFDNKLYFRGKAVNSNFGSELWVSDGTIAGTKMVKDIADGFSNSEVRNMTIYQNRLFFGAKTDFGNEKLWLLNTAGTNATEAYSAFAGNEYYGVDVLPFRDSLVFGGYRSAIGGELMMGNLTTNSLKVISDQSPASNDAFYPTNLTKTKKLLFFQATTTATGRELWAFDPLKSSVSVFRPELVAERLEVSPNPATDMLRISRGSLTGDCTIEVFDARGKAMLRSQIDASDSFSILSVQDLSAGVYQVIVRDARGGVGVARVVVQR